MKKSKLERVHIDQRRAASQIQAREVVDHDERLTTQPHLLNSQVIPFICSLNWALTWDKALQLSSDKPFLPTGMAGPVGSPAIAASLAGSVFCNFWNLYLTVPGRYDYIYDLPSHMAGVPIWGTYFFRSLGPGPGQAASSILTVWRSRQHHWHSTLAQSLAGH